MAIPKYVCACNGVTEEGVREAIRAGARTASEVRAKIGVIAACGLCTGHINLILDEVTKGTQPNEPPVR